MATYGDIDIWRLEEWDVAQGMSVQGSGGWRRGPSGYGRAVVAGRRVYHRICGGWGASPIARFSEGTSVPERVGRRPGAGFVVPRRLTRMPWLLRRWMADA